MQNEQLNLKHSDPETVVETEFIPFSVSHERIQALEMEIGTRILSMEARAHGFEVKILRPKRTESKP